MKNKTTKKTFMRNAMKGKIIKFNSFFCICLTAKRTNGESFVLMFLILGWNVLANANQRTTEKIRSI